MTHPLRCICPGCRLPFASVEDGRLIVTSRHNGEKHANSLTVEEVERLLAVMRAARVPEEMRAS